MPDLVTHHCRPKQIEPQFFGRPSLTAAEERELWWQKREALIDAAVRRARFVKTPWGFRAMYQNYLGVNVVDETFWPLVRREFRALTKKRHRSTA